MADDLVEFDDWEEEAPAAPAVVSTPPPIADKVPPVAPPVEEMPAEEPVSAAAVDAAAAADPPIDDTTTTNTTATEDAPGAQPAHTSVASHFHAHRMRRMADPSRQAHSSPFAQSSNQTPIAEPTATADPTLALCDTCHHSVVHIHCQECARDYCDSCDEHVHRAKELREHTRETVSQQVNAQQTSSDDASPTHVDTTAAVTQEPAALEETSYDEATFDDAEEVAPPVDAPVEAVEAAEPRVADTPAATEPLPEAETAAEPLSSDAPLPSDPVSEVPDDNIAAVALEDASQPIEAVVEPEPVIPAETVPEVAPSTDAAVAPSTQLAASPEEDYGDSFALSADAELETENTASPDPPPASEPAPVEPVPIEPVPTKVEPIEPEPIEPEPLESAPVVPEPVPVAEAEPVVEPSPPIATPSSPPPIIAAAAAAEDDYGEESFDAVNSARGAASARAVEAVPPAAALAPASPALTAPAPVVSAAVAPLTISLTPSGSPSFGTAVPPAQLLSPIASASPAAVPSPILSPTSAASALTPVALVAKEVPLDAKCDFCESAHGEVQCLTCDALGMGLVFCSSCSTDVHDNAKGRSHQVIDMNRPPPPPKPVVTPVIAPVTPIIPVTPTPLPSVTPTVPAAASKPVVAAPSKPTTKPSPSPSKPTAAPIIKPAPSKPARAAGPAAAHASPVKRPSVSHASPVRRPSVSSVAHGAVVSRSPSVASSTPGGSRRPSAIVARSPSPSKSPTRLKPRLGAAGAAPRRRRLPVCSFCHSAQVVYHCGACTDRALTSCATCWTSNHRLMSEHVLERRLVQGALDPEAPLQLRKTPTPPPTPPPPARVRAESIMEESIEDKVIAPPPPPPVQPPLARAVSAVAPPPAIPFPDTRLNGVVESVFTLLAQADESPDNARPSLGGLTVPLSVIFHASQPSVVFVTDENGRMQRRPWIPLARDEALLALDSNNVPPTAVAPDDAPERTAAVCYSTQSGVPAVALTARQVRALFGLVDGDEYASTTASLPRGSFLLQRFAPPPGRHATAYRVCADWSEIAATREEADAVGASPNDETPSPHLLVSVCTNPHGLSATPISSGDGANGVEHPSLVRRSSGVPPSAALAVKTRESKEVPVTTRPTTSIESTTGPPPPHDEVARCLRLSRHIYRAFSRARLGRIARLSVVVSPSRREEPELIAEETSGGAVSARGDESARALAASSTADAAVQWNFCFADLLEMEPNDAPPPEPVVATPVAPTPPPVKAPKSLPASRGPSPAPVPRPARATPSPAPVLRPIISPSPPPRPSPPPPPPPPQPIVQAPTYKRQPSPAKSKSKKKVVPRVPRMPATRLRGAGGQMVLDLPYCAKCCTPFPHASSSSVRNAAGSLTMFRQVLLKWIPNSLYEYPEDLFADVLGIDTRDDAADWHKAVVRICTECREEMRALKTVPPRTQLAPWLAAAADSATKATTAAAVSPARAKKSRAPGAVSVAGFVPGGNSASVPVLPYLARAPSLHPSASGFAAVLRPPTAKKSNNKNRVPMSVLLESPPPPLLADKPQARREEPLKHPIAGGDARAHRRRMRGGADTDDDSDDDSESESEEDDEEDDEEYEEDEYENDEAAPANGAVVTATKDSIVEDDEYADDTFDMSARGAQTATAVVPAKPVQPTSPYAQKMKRSKKEKTKKPKKDKKSKEDRKKRSKKKKAPEPFFPPVLSPYSSGQHARARELERERSLAQAIRDAQVHTSSSPHRSVAPSRMRSTKSLVALHPLPSLGTPNPIRTPSPPPPQKTHIQIPPSTPATLQPLSSRLASPPIQPQVLPSSTPSRLMSPPAQLQPLISPQPTPSPPQSATPSLHHAAAVVTPPAAHCFSAAIQPLFRREHRTASRACASGVGPVSREPTDHNIPAGRDCIPTDRDRE